MTYMEHAFVTVAIPFASKLAGDVDAALASFVDKSLGNQPVEELVATLKETRIVHFMSITVVRPECPADRSEVPPWPPRDPAEPAHLLIEVSADGGAAEVLAVLAASMGPELEKILAAAQIRHDGELAPFLLKNHWVIGARWNFVARFFGWLFPGSRKVRHALGQIFTGSPGLSVRRIIAEKELARRIGDLIQASRGDRGWRNSSARQRLDLIRGRLWEEFPETGQEYGNYKWAFVPEPAPCLPGDPRNQWNDSGYTYSNPQAGKALTSILHTLLWPLYAPFVLAVAIAALVTWRRYDVSIAVLWASYVTGALLSALVLGIVVLFLRLHRQEKLDPSDEVVPPSDQVEALMRRENFCAQNHLASVSRLKTGRLRRLTLRLAFIVVGSGRFVGAPGHLGKNGVIHFARWMRLPGTDQLLFWSNYDGTWESYVADFIADAPSGVTAIWSNCRGFPKTKWLFGDGAENRDRLVPWARRQQQLTSFWYSAYPDLTAERIRNNAAIRQGIASAESEADAADWLALFGSAPRPASTMRTGEIPTLVFGGLSRMPYADCHVVTFSKNAENCRKWLTRVAEDATYGESYPGETWAIVVAFSASGLHRLEVPAQALATFPTAFQQGMSKPWRARALGDSGTNAPDNWIWGANDGDGGADALLLIYGTTGLERDGISNKLVGAARELGHRIHTVPLAPGKSAKERAAAGGALPMEPFGFADGVSQPVIHEVARAHDSKDDLVHPGEIVLGYPDNTGKVPPSPSIEARYDPDRYLPDSGPDSGRRRPEFSRYEGSGMRDLGANATFLVVRQLEQNNTALQAWLDETFEELKKDNVTIGANAVSFLGEEPDQAGIATAEHAAYAREANRREESAPPGVEEPIVAGSALTSSAEAAAPGAGGAYSRKRIAGFTPPDDTQALLVKQALAARLVGRWQDGTSLVRHRLEPGTSKDPTVKPDNDFRFGEEDPLGLCCPFGAHIRRANPRDTRFPGSQEEIDGVNRHRILRVGRSYKYPDTDGKKGREGLLFMCLNADIERQFEFIQKTWLLNKNIHGLEDEVDPIVGSGTRNFTLPTATGPIRFSIDKQFVTVVGGEYFFLPGRGALRFLAHGPSPA